MLSQTSLKLTIFCGTLISLSGIAMEPQKRIITDIYAEVKDNLNLYGETYKSDLIELSSSINANTFAKTIAILKEMADNTINYTQEDKNNLLALVHIYAEQLYQNELIGFYPNGTLAKHKKVLCSINTQCTQATDQNNEVDSQQAEQFVFTKKSCSRKNAPVEKKENIDPVDIFAKNLQTNIDTIRHARTLAHFRQDNTDVSNDIVINKAIKKWFAEFMVVLQKAIAKKDDKLLANLWRANFNNNALHFKAREEMIKDSAIEKLKKDTIDEESITWFTSQANQFVYAKESTSTLKSKTKQQTTISAVKTTPTPQVITLSQRISGTLMRLNNITELDAITEVLGDLKATLNSKDKPTLTASDIAGIKFEIEESIRRIYQNCLLGLYGDHEQKLQQHVFETCVDQLIIFNTQLSMHLKESDKTINAYVKNANQRKEACLYEIKVIRDAEKIATPEDIKVWKTIIQDRLSSQLEAQNALGIQKTIQANFDANKNPLLAEQYEHIVPDIYNQKNTGTTWPVWLKNNKQSFVRPMGQAEELMPTHSILQSCKNHWILSSLALTAIATGIYYAYEQYYAEDEDDKPAQQEDTNKETAEKSTASDQNNKAKKPKAKTA